jgi:lysophospholipase L1-like esterase
VPSRLGCRFADDRLDDEGGHRLLFIGSSQTVGAGAEDGEGTFFARVHRTLSRALAPTSLESLNAAVSGANSHRLLRIYRARYARFRPDLVVINLGNNDAHARFAQGLSGFLALNQRLGIQAVLIEEANSAERRQSALHRKHEIMRALAKRNGVPIYGLDAFFNQPGIIDSGLLWWDHVHLSPYGHAVAANWLAPKLLPFFAHAP